MKRLVAYLASIALAMSLFGCSSGEPSGNGSTQTESSASTADNTATNASASTSQSGPYTDIFGISSEIAEPPIPCTQRQRVENLVVMIPEDWEAEIGTGGYLKITSGTDVRGFLGLEDSGDTTFDEADIESSLTDFVNQNLSQISSSEFTMDTNAAIQKKDDLTYVIIPFTDSYSNDEGKTTNQYGYSYCGYDDEIIIGDFITTKDDKDVLGTFRWILSNIQILESNN